MVTSSFVDPGLLSLASFDTHLLAYSPLFSTLPTVRFVYIATRTTHCKAAETLFLSRMHRTPNSDPGEEVLRYFSLRKLWEAKQFGTLTYNDTKFASDTNLSDHAAHPAAAPGGGKANESRLLTVSEVAELLQVTVSWVYGRTRNRSRERLPGYRLGKYWRFREDGQCAEPRNA